MPRGFGPNGYDFLPSGAVTSATTKCQVPVRRSLRLLPCAFAAPPPMAASMPAAAMMLRTRDIDVIAASP